MLPSVDITIDVETLKQQPVCTEILQMLTIVRPAWCQQPQNIRQSVGSYFLNFWLVRGHLKLGNYVTDLHKDV